MPWRSFYRIGGYLSNPLARTDLRPPAEPGLYVISRQQWRGLAPDSGDVPLYAGQTGDLRYRLGQIIAETLGFTGENPGYSSSYYHSGGRRVWQYCVYKQHERLRFFRGMVYGMPLS